MKPKAISVLIWSVLTLCILVVSFGIIPVRREVKKEKNLTSEKINLANRLRQDGLNIAAIKEYDETLNSRYVSEQEKSNICLIVGNIYFDELKDTEKALEYYTKAKYYAKGKLDKDSNVNQRIVECLEKLNRPADAQYQLSKSTYLAGQETVKYPGSVVAKIGEREITMGELESIIQKLPKFKKDIIKTPEDKLNYLKEYVGSLIMSAAARRQGLDKEKDFMEQMSEIEIQLLANKLYEKEVMDKIKVTDLERKYYYESNKDQFVVPQKYKIAHILCSEEAEAKKIRSKLLDGESFEKVAKEFSQDVNTKNSGGVLGEIIQSSTNIPTIGNEPEIVKKLFDLKSGEISSVLKSQKGFHIFKILEITPERKRKYEEVQDIVENKLKMEKENQSRSEFVDKLMKAEQVFIFEGEFKTSSPSNSEEEKDKQNEEQKTEEK